MPRGETKYSLSFSICHASATTLSLSPFCAEIVIISGWMVMGSWTCKVYLSGAEDMFMVGNCVGGGVRRGRSVGDGAS